MLSSFHDEIYETTRNDNRFHDLFSLEKFLDASIRLRESFKIILLNVGWNRNTAANFTHNLYGDFDLVILGVRLDKLWPWLVGQSVTVAK